MIARLSERFRLLQSRAPDLPPRQRALRAAIDWSHDLLGDEDKALFAQLSVFAGGFTLDDAEAVCEAFDVFEGVMTLRGHSLLGSDTDAATQEARFSLMESLREYAGEKLRDAPDAEQQALAERHARHFLARAEAELARLRTEGEADALRRLDTNSPNLRGAAAWAENTDPASARPPQPRPGPPAPAARLPERGRRPIEAGIAAANTAADATFLARLLTERAGLHLDLAQPADARARAADALALFQQHGNAAGEADAENLLGQAALDEKRYDDARAHFARALELRESLNSRVEAAIVRNNLGLVEYFDPNGDRDRAVEHLTEALRVRRAAGDRRGVAAALNNLGNLAFARQDWAEAERTFAETLENERALRHPFGVARALNNLGEVAEERGEYPRAARLYIAAEHLFREVKHGLRHLLGGTARRPFRPRRLD
jgi:tetratricopeptide (TPR) repeat protein